MKKLLKLFYIKGKSSRVEFILITIIAYLFTLYGATFILGSAFSGVNFKYINLFVKIFIILFWIVLYIWIITGIKRCRAIKIPITIFFIPMILLTISFMINIYMGLDLYIILKASFMMQIVIIIILSIINGK